MENLVAALETIDYRFLRMKSTAQDSCDISSAASCMEPSELYFWNDMIMAVDKVASVGVGGSKLYVGNGIKYGLVNLAAFLAQSMQESIQYDACDENNWSDAGTVAHMGGTVYTAASACGQLGQSYQDYKCSDMIDPETNRPIPAEDLQCDVDTEMTIVAETHARWYGAPAPLFCAPRSIIPEAPRWDHDGWCPSKGTTWNQADEWAPPFSTMSRGEVHYGPGESTASVPPEILVNQPTYLDYVLASTDQGTSEACLQAGECCMDVDNQRAGSWVSCEGGCPNAAAPELIVGREARTDVEGCCWWGRGVIQTTGICNFGKLNYFIGKKAADRGRQAMFPNVDFCRDPEVICRGEHGDLKWVAGLYYWLESVQPYTAPGVSYMQTLHEWVDAGMDTHDTTLIDFASGIVNRGCHDGNCGTGPVHALSARAKNFAHIMDVLKPAFEMNARRSLLFG